MFNLVGNGWRWKSRQPANPNDIVKGHDQRSQFSATPTRRHDDLVLELLPSSVKPFPQPWSPSPPALTISYDLWPMNASTPASSARVASPLLLVHDNSVFHKFSPAARARPSSSIRRHVPPHPFEASIFTKRRALNRDHYGKSSLAWICLAYEHWEE